ncbi:hypothetical protein ACRALDRAFT_2137318 [Sodiomyces alcalophilus JCM 7366]|uniref:uncharacterized protein n=1 Tax=Sodiomyces alcalophilus JCM 7366 TaxID=591952 RepID=UPI0039B40962
MSAAGGNYPPRAKKMKIDELIGLLGPAPPPRDAPLTDDLLREITRIYHEIYVYGLNAFFETAWFDTRDAKGICTFPNNKHAVDHFATFLQAIQTTQPNDRASMLSSGILEARLIWVLASLPYTMGPARVNNSINGLPHPGDPAEIRNRVHVFEVLLSGDYIDSNPLAIPVPHADLHRTREFDFWRTLGDYVTFRDEPSLSRAAQREEALGRLRLLLDGRENRDLLYSVAIARELSPRYPPGYENAVPQHVDESDPKNKLFVACDFIRREAQATGGTTNVVRRFSELANQAFINPGVNVAKAVSPGIIPTP